MRQEDNVTTPNIQTNEPETSEARYAREKREELALEHSILSPLAAEGVDETLAAKVGGTWDVEFIDEPNPHWQGSRTREVRATQLVEDGISLTFEANYNPRDKRVVVRPLLPKGVEHKHIPYNDRRPDASFAPDRGVTGLAQSIKRIVVESRRVVTAAVEAKQRDDDYNTRANRTAARAAKALGITPPKREGTSDLRLYASPASVSGLEANVYNEEVTFTVRSVPIDLAEKLFKLIVSAKPRKGD